MPTELLLLVVVGWVIVSNILDGRQKKKEALLLEMKEFYSKREALDLVYEVKRTATGTSLIFGLVVGVLISSIIIEL